MIRTLLLCLAALLVGAALNLMATYGHGAARPSDKALSRCFVYLPAMRDAKLRRWCLAQSRKLP